MRDRFTVTLFVIVVFVGGLLAMVGVARWRTGKQESPAAQLEAAAQAIPEAVPELPDPLPARAPAEESATESVTESAAESGPLAGEAANAPDVGPRGGAKAATPRGEPAQPVSTPPVERVAAAPREAQPPRDEPSSPPSGSSGATGRDRSTKSSAGALPAPQSFVTDVVPQQGTGRSSGRRPAPGSETTTPGAGDEATGAADDAQIPDEYEPPDGSNDPPGDPPRLDDPIDEPDAEPDVEPEPEPPPPALVRVSAPPTVFSVDDVVPVLVEIHGGTDVGHVPFHLAFDPRVLRFDHGSEGGFLNTDGSPTVFWATSASGGDAVVVGLSRLGHGPGIDGAGVLCELNFVAIGPGTTQLIFKLAAVKDSGNGPMLSAFESGSVSVVANP